MRGRGWAVNARMLQFALTVVALPACRAQPATPSEGAHNVAGPSSQDSGEGGSGDWHEWRMLDGTDQNWVVCGILLDSSLKCIAMGEEAMALGPDLDALLDWPQGEFQFVSTGWTHACAISLGGVVECWGDGPAAVAPAGLEGFAAVDCGPDYSCAYGPDQATQCWGNPSGSPLPTTVPMVDVQTTFASRCGIGVDGVGRCWGEGDWLGELPLLETIDGGLEGVCGTRVEGGAWCDGTAYMPGSPPELEDVPLLVVIVTYYEACALLPGGDVFCWGREPYFNRPTDAGGFRSLTSTGFGVCGVNFENEAHCWGWNLYADELSRAPDDDEEPHRWRL